MVLPADGLLVHGLLAALVAGGAPGLIPNLGLAVPLHDHSTIDQKQLILYR